MNFEDLVWLFDCNNRNRKIIRMNFDEAALLWKTVKMTAGPILEIGRYYGGSTVLLWAASKDREIFSIDLYQEHHSLCEKIFQDPINRKYIHLLIQDSGEPLPNKNYGFAFIDGDHTYSGVLKDTLAHWNALKSFDNYPPLFAYHDTIPNDGLKYCNQPNHCEDITLLCDELIDLGCAEKFDSAGSLLVLKKIKDLPQNFSIRKKFLLNTNIFIKKSEKGFNINPRIKNLYKETKDKLMKLYVKARNLYQKK